MKNLNRLLVRYLFPTLFAAFFCMPNQLLAQLEEGDTEESTIIATFTDTEIKERLAQIDHMCIPMTFNAVVRGYVRTYVQRKPEKTKTMLGKRLVYFELFEEKLKEHGMPADLKYLAVLESALNATAVSHAGASGLWQFMPATGREYGLDINSTVDERSDPVRSTEAACQYLKRLYNSYGDWSLAMAAYNSGPGNVNKAIKRSHSRNFWNLQRFLPRETRNYVPAFIGATYICNFHGLHGIFAEEPPLDMQLNVYLKVFEGLSFQEINDMTGVELDIIKELNPSYLQSYIPNSSAGNYIILPYRVMNSFVDALNKRGGRVYSADYENKIYSGAPTEGDYDNYTASSYYISTSDHINRIAKSLNCSDDHLIAWNNLSQPYVQAGTFLQVWRPVLAQSHNAISIKAKPSSQQSGYVENKPQTVKKEAPKKAPTIKVMPPLESNALAMVPNTVPQIKNEDIPVENQYIFHIMGRNESLQAVAQKYDIELSKLMELNPKTRLRVGTRIKIKAIEIK